MTFKETMKDIGRTLIGQGSEVKFKNDVETFATSHRVSKADAQKAIFDARLTSVDHEVTLHGAIDYHSKEFSSVQSALYEMVGSKEMERYKAFAESPGVMRPLRVVPAPGEIRSVQKYFKDKFDGAAPTNVIVIDSAEKTKMILELASRFSGDARIGSPADLKTILGTNHDLAADLGRMLQAKEELERHERMFGREVGFDKAWTELKKTGRESLATMLWHAPAAYLKKFNIPTNGKAFAKHLGAMMSMLGSELKAGAEVVIDASVVASHALRNNRVFETVTDTPKKFIKRVIKP